MPAVTPTPLSLKSRSRSKSKSNKKKALSHGRPPTLTQHHHPSTSISSKSTAAIIRTHHRLHKALARAQATNDTVLAASLQAQIDAAGGLAAYQAASATGQRADRGGDSSRVLIDWLAPTAARRRELQARGIRWRLLEVGALATDNACARSGLFDVVRIDLQARVPGILQQDFMERSLPVRTEEQQGSGGGGGDGDAGTFDVLSLSLVLNYVPDAKGRGEMLRRTTHFLASTSGSTNEELPVPALFLVLPAPCVTNSRYLDEERLAQIMASLGYVMLHRKLSAKLVYYLWRLQAVDEHRVKGKERPKAFPKVEVNPGGARNNFAVVLDV